jgi:hypothetical protein
MFATPSCSRITPERGCFRPHAHRRAMTAEAPVLPYKNAAPEGADSSRSRRTAACSAIGLNAAIPGPARAPTDARAEGRQRSRSPRCSRADFSNTPRFAKRPHYFSTPSVRPDFPRVVRGAVRQHVFGAPAVLTVGISVVRGADRYSDPWNRWSRTVRKMGLENGAFASLPTSAWETDRSALG